MLLGCDPGSGNRDNLARPRHATDAGIRSAAERAARPVYPFSYTPPANLRASGACSRSSHALTSENGSDSGWKPFYPDKLLFSTSGQGSLKIYLNRHIVRAFEEAKSKLLPLGLGRSPMIHESANPLELYRPVPAEGCGLPVTSPQHPEW
jgi:hypothetical protein